MIGTTELIVILVVVLVLFGATAIPRLARSLGRAKKEFEKGLKEGQLEEPDGDREAGNRDGTGDRGGQEG